MTKPKISVIVPAYNSAQSLKTFLDSFFDSVLKNYEIIVNDEVKSNDETKRIIDDYKKRGIPVIYMRENHSMAQGRKSGASKAQSALLLHLDTDMKVTPNLLEECVKLINYGFDALVIPEESYGTTFWARCKWLEKRCYNNEDSVESLRCVKKSIYNKLGGHDEELVFSEDKDFDLRVREIGSKIGRTTNFLYHNEGALKLFDTVKKKHGYTKTANLFADRHPQQFKKQTNIFLRYSYFLKNYRYLFAHPILYIGMLYMKTFEFGYGAYGIFKQKLED